MRLIQVSNIYFLHLGAIQKNFSIPSTLAFRYIVKQYGQKARRYRVKQYGRKARAPLPLYQKGGEKKQIGFTPAAQRDPAQVKRIQIKFMIYNSHSTISPSSKPKPVYFFGNKQPSKLLYQLQKPRPHEAILFMIYSFHYLLRENQEIRQKHLDAK